MKSYIDFMKRLGTTDNFTSSQENFPPTWAYEEGFPYKFIGKDAAKFHSLFDWTGGKKPQDFAELTFQVRSSGWQPEVGQAITIQIFGENEKYRCLQMSVEEFRENFEITSEGMEYIRSIGDEYRNKTDLVLSEAA